MPKGGKREGAGRKPGVPNRRTTEMYKKMAEGELPVPFLLRVMRADPNLGDTTLSMRVSAGVAAAPYIHPRRQPVDSGGDAKQTIEVKFTDRDIARRIMAKLRKAQAEKDTEQ